MTNKRNKCIESINNNVKNSLLTQLLTPTINRINISNQNMIPVKRKNTSHNLLIP